MGVDSLQAPGEEQETGREAPARTHDGGQGHGGGGGNVEKQTDSGSALKVETTDLLPG